VGVAARRPGERTVLVERRGDLGPGEQGGVGVALQEPRRLPGAFRSGGAVPEHLRFVGVEERELPFSDRHVATRPSASRYARSTASAGGAQAIRVEAISPISSASPSTVYERRGPRSALLVSSTPGHRGQHDQRRKR
jgi:hypothetical protein